MLTRIYKCRNYLFSEFISILPIAVFPHTSLVLWAVFPSWSLGYWSSWNLQYLLDLFGKSVWHLVVRLRNVHCSLNGGSKLSIWAVVNVHGCSWLCDGLVACLGYVHAFKHHSCAVYLSKYGCFQLQRGTAGHKLMADILVVFHIFYLQSLVRRGITEWRQTFAPVQFSSLGLYAHYSPTQGHGSIWTRS